MPQTVGCGTLKRHLVLSGNPLTHCDALCTCSPDEGWRCNCRMTFSTSITKIIETHPRNRWFDGALPGDGTTPRPSLRNGMSFRHIQGVSEKGWFVEVSHTQRCQFPSLAGMFLRPERPPSVSRLVESRVERWCGSLGVGLICCRAFRCRCPLYVVPLLCSESRFGRRNAIAIANGANSAAEQAIASRT